MSKDFLTQIVAHKRAIVTELRAQNDVEKWRVPAWQTRANRPRHRLREALKTNLPTLKVIAEFKRRSPSHGVIRDGMAPGDVARSYERGGASAISVLTENECFGGSIDDLIAVRASTRLPVLRKDFTIDPIQIYEAASCGADAILLIAAVLHDPALQTMRTIAEDELGLDALVEVHTSDELRRATGAGAKLIGVNNRDLRTFEVSLRTSEQLMAEARGDAVLISESGLQTAAQLRHLHLLGFRGFLIGEALMRAPDPASALRDMIEEFERATLLPSAT